MGDITDIQEYFINKYLTNFYKTGIFTCKAWKEVNLPPTQNVASLGPIHKSPTPVRILSQIYPVHVPIQRLKEPFYYYPPIYARVLHVVSFPQVSPPNPVRTSPVPSTR